MIWQAGTVADSSANPTPRAAGARERARAEVRNEILAAARARVAVDGAAGLSLRAVARDVGMVSSAVYRYFAGRDELLTALIIDAYDTLGELTERSAASTRRLRPLERWVTAALTIRTWAVEHPHDHALLYGSPIPGYAAPADTVVPGTRVSRALLGIVHDAVADGRMARDAVPEAPRLSRATKQAFATLRAELDLEASDAQVLAVVNAWTQLFGLVSFEVFGQTRGLIDDHEAFTRESATAMATRIGLT